jgi:hypothetical protein
VSAVSDPDLEAVLAALDERAKRDPRLEQYRVVGRPDALLGLPDGWSVSRSVERLAVHGGWWPGRWDFPMVEEIVELVLTGGTVPRPAWMSREPTVRWVGLGTVWERDSFWTPLLREEVPDAPVFGFSSQALWASMVFPSEAALLEAFLLTYDELGIEAEGGVNPFFVEWVTNPPSPVDAPPEAIAVHERLVARSAEWTAEHPCWVPGRMPRLDDGLWPDELIAALLGLVAPPTNDEP